MPSGSIPGVAHWTAGYFHKEDWPFTGQLSLCFEENIALATFFVILSVYVFRFFGRNEWIFY